MEKLAWGEFYQCLELLYPGFLQGWKCCKSRVTVLPSRLFHVRWEFEEVTQIAARYCDRTHGRSDSDRFILLQKEDLRVILLNNCADKWQLHSITFQWEHYSHNIGNGKTFSCAFQLGDDVWKEPIGAVRHRHGELMTSGATAEPAPRKGTPKSGQPGSRMANAAPPHPTKGCKEEWRPAAAGQDSKEEHSERGIQAAGIPRCRPRSARNGLLSPVTMVRADGMACPGIKQRTNESKQNKWEGWNPACRRTIVPRPSRQISASESATSQEYEAKQSFNGAKRP